MSKSKYTEKDAAKDTGATPKEVAEAWHEARNDSAGSWGVPSDRHSDGNKDEKSEKDKGSDSGK